MVRKASMKEQKIGASEVPILLVSLGLLIFSLSVNGQNMDDGFISIDCGQEKNYTDTATGLRYVSDFDGFVDTGETHKIPTDMEQYATNQQGYHLRSFPNGIRNCYRLLVDENKKYLIRASFMYGNYDQRNNPPQFDLYLNVDLWSSVDLRGRSKTHVFLEISVFASRNWMFVCVVNTGLGTPFVSSLELRPLKDDMYPLVTNNQSFVLFQRSNVQPIRNETLRYPTDIYDRFWIPYYSKSLETLSTESKIVQCTACLKYPAPMDVLKTCGAPIANGSDINITFQWPLNNITSRKIVYAFHYAEIQSLTTNQSRNFSFFKSFQDRSSGPFKFPKYLTATYLHKPTPVQVSIDFFYMTFRKTKNSTLPPLLSAMEIYEVKQTSKLISTGKEVEAMMEIKKSYKLEKNWQGDPCAPENLIWKGIKCRKFSIVSLNMSSNGLSGKIALSIRDLKQLENLDLSNNKLNGKIPHFLSDLESLKFLDVSRNNLNGDIPEGLKIKIEDGFLNIRFEGNPNLYKKSNKIVIIIPIVVITLVIIAITVIVVVIWKRKRKLYGRKRIIESKGRGSFRLPSFSSNNKILTYIDLINITNDFDKIIGQGGFGTVYHGTMNNGIQVAVKHLSVASSQGSKEFQMEAHLLTTIHHKNIVPLVGYCNEKDHLALVYEYMVGGNLKDHLSGSISSLTKICWRDRLRIALEVAEGLDYLHRGCKTTIIHRDIKTSNILLSEKLEAMIADFGLCKIFENNDAMTHMSTNVLGTPGYLDPEYRKTHKLKEKSDVYSFGIVLLELITGKPAVIKNADEDYILLAEWVDSIHAQGDILAIVDPKLNGEYDINSAGKALEIASACTPSLSIQRSSMHDIVTLLKECLEIEITCGTCKYISSDFMANYEDEMITGPTIR
ncbi:putative Protein kinase [Zostera marina]|uniref:non-specific serine/threonine protein kinase n=1 Tax=Zostera marina TaxID=29655 RepID=A0A0K9PUH1_ZOSMR|nr:putative Protein kinase [Zostera marina]